MCDRGTTIGSTPQRARSVSWPPAHLAYSPTRAPAHAPGCHRRQCGEARRVRAIRAHGRCCPPQRSAAVSQAHVPHAWTSGTGPSSYAETSGHPRPIAQTSSSCIQRFLYWSRWSARSRRPPPASFYTSAWFCLRQCLARTCIVQTRLR